MFKRLFDINHLMISNVHYNSSRIFSSLFHSCPCHCTTLSFLLLTLFSSFSPGWLWKAKGRLKIFLWLDHISLYLYPHFAHVISWRHKVLSITYLLRLKQSYELQLLHANEILLFIFDSITYYSNHLFMGHDIIICIRFDTFNVFI